MKSWRSHVVLILVTVAVPAMRGFAGETTPQSEVVIERVALVAVETEGLRFSPLQVNTGMLLAVSGPEEYHFRHRFEAGSEPFLPVIGLDGNGLPEGVYTYELRPLSGMSPGMVTQLNAAERAEEQRSLTAQKGHFRIRAGSVASGSRVIEVVTQDIMLLDDTIIHGRMCVGGDCELNEDFETDNDTLRLKNHNLRIHFDDTSTDPDFPSNSWRIAVNDSESTGVDRFSIEDADGSTTPFTIRAGAPDDSFYVDPDGNVGLGTATPGTILDIVDSWPEVRLSSTAGQNNMWGFQTNPHTGRLVIRDDRGPGEDVRIPVKFEMGATNNLLRVGFPNTGSVEVGGDLYVTGVLSANSKRMNLPDFVFAPDYQLMPLNELKRYVARERHLPNVPSAEEVHAAQAVDLVDMQSRMLEKIEELTLYTISQHEVIAQQRQLINELRKRVEALERDSDQN